jgi:hypothetical protein
MVSVSDISEHVGRLAAEQISLSAFEDWFVSVRQDIHLHAGTDVQKIAFAIDDALSQFEEDSPALRNALIEALFAVQELPVSQNRAGEPSPKAESTAAYDLIIADVA